MTGKKQTNKKKNPHTHKKNPGCLGGEGNSKFGTWEYLRERGTDGLSSINRQKLIKIKGLRANKVAQKKGKKNTVPGQISNLHALY